MKCVQALLESLHKVSLIARLASDVSVTEHTAIGGHFGVLSTLQGYFIGNNLERHNNQRTVWTIRHKPRMPTKRFTTQTTLSLLEKMSHRVRQRLYPTRPIVLGSSKLIYNKSM